MIAARRSQQLHQLKTVYFDLLVVGGGIVGAGIARDAAMRGLKVALIEQGDFAGGTSSKTSKLIHGGLRYLEQGHFRLVAESLNERKIIQLIAPNCVQRQSLMLPVYAHRSRRAWQIHAGLTLYDLFAGNRNAAASRMLSAQEAMAREPELESSGLIGAGSYWDCRMDDSRLCLANILQAARFGAVCVNYVKLIAWLKHEGQIEGGLIQDCFGKETVEVRARCTVNATGPWSDKLRRLSNPASEKRLAPTKGIHLITPRLAQNALFVEARQDKRMFFILPWEKDYSLIGTTESAVKEPLEALKALPDEVAQLIEEVNRVLPSSFLSEEDIVATYAGARPLLNFQGSSTQASREHRIEVDGAGLVSVLGGKYTTFRVMAKQAVDAVVRLKRFSAEACLTSQVTLVEPVHDVLIEQIPELARLVDPQTMEQLVARYGAGVVQVLHILGAEPSLADRVCLHHDTLAAEIVTMIRNEMACTISDVMLRRTHMAWSACQGRDALPLVEDLFERYGGLTPHQVDGQIKEYEKLLAESLAFRRARSATNRVLV